MAYEELRQPNLSVTGHAGYCLSVQQDVWGTPHLYATAKDAYDAAQFKHPGELPPEGIHALCYWTYTEGGIPYWHVATRTPDGRVFSSPFNVSYGNEWFSSIDAMTARIRRIYPACQYVAWVEDLSNVRLVKEDDMNTDAIKDDDIDILRILHSELGGWDFNATHSGANDATFLAAWSGQSLRQLVREQWKAETTKRYQLVDAAASYKAQLEKAQSDAAAVLADDAATKQQLKDALQTVADLRAKPTISQDTLDQIAETNKNVKSIKGTLANVWGGIKKLLGGK